MMDRLLWLVNLNDRKLYSLRTDSDNNPSTPPTASDVSSFNLPAASCIGGTFRPFAVKVYRGDVYIGGVCDASLSQNEANLEAIVYRLRQNTFTEVLRFDLDYEKGWAASQNNCELFPGWYPWLDQVPVACDQGPTRVYPQPIFSDIEFDVDGSMILGFMDRLGHQLGNKNYPITGTSPLISTISGGDILRAYLEDNGDFTIENNATAGPLTTLGVGNGEGPGGGEFYNRDVFEGQINNLIPAPHAETAQGGLAFWPGSGEIATTALDPYSTVFNSGGVNWMNNRTGAVRDPGYMLYRSASSSISLFSKANGLGDMEPVCGLAPLQIGGMVWRDDNSDGIQDACEVPLTNIQIGLYNTNGTLLASVSSDSKGEYYFDNSNMGSNSLNRFTDYYVVFGINGQYNTSNYQLNGNYFITRENVGMAPLNDRTDSDITLALGGIANGAFNLLPHLKVRTGDYGFVDHSNDAGFTPENLNPIAGIGGYVWEDLNQNGIQNNNEPAISNVRVQLYNQTSGLVGTTTTDVNGRYFFQNVSNGTFYVQFTSPSGLIGTIQNAGNGSNDSDPNPITGTTNTFQFHPIDGDNNDIDAGYYKPTGSLGGYVWEDANENGIQNNGENPIEDVVVQLQGNTGNVLATTSTDGNGNYTFSNLQAGIYRIAFITPSGYVITIQNAGNGNNDSDPNQNTGITNNISFDPFNGNIENIDAGYFVPTAAIGGYVWQDVNKDGLQANNENPIEGVTVDLLQGGNTVQTTTTNANGVYSFTGITSGTYQIRFDVSTNSSGINNYQATLMDAGNDNIDSDVDPNTGLTQAFTFDAQSGNADLDAGYILPSGSISGLAYKDCNKNGIREAGEMLLADIEVVLSGTKQETTTTNTNGTYTFDDLDQGTYTITFRIPQNSGLGFTLANQGNDDSIDSDVNASGAIVNISLPAGDNLENMDAGFTDEEAPVLTGVPANQTLDCGDPTITNPPSVTATDNCDPQVSVQFDEKTIQLGGACNGGFQVIRTWTATDNCGNTTTESQTITVADTEAPVITGVPGSVTVPCDDVPEPPTVVKAIDNCDPDAVLTFNETLTGNCPQILTRIWTATDDCGNTSTASQVITIVDQEAPQIVVTHPLLQGLNPWDTLIVDCDNIPTLTLGDAYATDDCSNPDLRFVEDVYNATDCKDEGFLSIMKCGWLATDACGNQTEVRFVFIVKDEEAPVINNVPGNITVDLTAGDTIPVVPTNITATDNCDAHVPVRISSSTVQGICQYVLTRTWTAEDDCGNATTASQEITVIQPCICPETELTSVDITPACGSRGGTARVNANGDLSDYDVVWIPNLGTRTADPVFRTNLPVGTYLVIISHPVIPNCDDKIYFTIEEDCNNPCPNVFDEVYVEVELNDCGDSATICANIPVSEIGDWTFNLNSLYITPGSTPCNGNPNQTEIKLPVGKHWLMVSNNLTGCADTIDVDVSCPVPCPDIFDEVYVEVELNDCNDSAEICVNIPTADLSNWTFNLNSLYFQPGTEVCPSNPNQSLIKLPEGKHWLMATNNLTGCADTIDVLVSCPVDPCLNFEIFTSEYEVFEINNCDDSLAFCLPVNLTDLGNYTLEVNSSVINNLSANCPGTQHAELKLAVGKYWLIITENATGCSDTLDIDVNCTPQPSPCDSFSIFTNHLLDIELDDCADLGTVCLPVSRMDYNDYNWYLNGQPYQGALGNCAVAKTTFYSYLGLLNLAPNGPYTIDQWNVNGQNYTGQVSNIQGLVDFMNQHDSNGNWVLDPVTYVIAGGTPNGTYGNLRIQPSNGNGLAILEANSNVLSSGTAWELPAGEHTIEVEDKLNGCKDSLKVRIQCPGVHITTDTIFIDLLVGEEGTACFDTNELPGNITGENWSCTNNCFIYDEISYQSLCLTVEGMEPGTSYNRMEICDDLGYCDITIVVVRVSEPAPGNDLPLANADYLEVPNGTPIVIKVLDNDSINGTLQSLTVLEAPEYGALVQNLNGMFTYIPPFNFCGEETFIYELCNENGCDTAIVYLDVECNSLQVMTGFSPNGDQINDYFTILGIENHPNNELLIFNRWGNLVYETESYKNDWDGTFNGTALPDGTYYYIFKYDEAQQLSGYLEMQR
ncbi:MAG: SdrD B-like domain-containing protein [Saprospiraceae bacterium]